MSRRVRVQGVPWIVWRGTTLKSSHHNLRGLCHPSLRNWEPTATVAKTWTGLWNQWAARAMAVLQDSEFTETHSLETAWMRANYQSRETTAMNHLKEYIHSHLKTLSRKLRMMSRRRIRTLQSQTSKLSCDSQSINLSRSNSQMKDLKFQTRLTM